MRLALAALAALLAGCLAGNGPAPVTTTPPAAPALHFLDQVDLPSARGFAEPSLKVAPDGTIYVTAPGSNGATPRQGVPGAPLPADTVWRSDDGGKTFQVLLTPDTAFGGGDSDLAVAPDGTVAHSGLWGNCVSVSTSRDKGATWRTDPLACGNAVTGNDRNWVAMMDGATAFVTFGWAPGAGPLGMAAPPSIALVKVRFDQDPPATTTALLADDYQWPGGIAVDRASKNVYVTYNTVDDHIVLLRSADQGATLTKHVVAARPGDTFDSFTVAAVDAAGTVYVAWSERDKPDASSANETDHTDVFVAWSKDKGDTWSRPVQVDAGVGTAIFPWIDAGAADHLVVAWYGTDAHGANAEKVNGLWFVDVADTRDATAASPTWVRGRASPLAVTQGSICTSGTGCARGTRDLLDYFEVALGKDDAAHLAWATRGHEGAFKKDNPVQLAYAKQLIGTPSSAG